MLHLRPGYLSSSKYQISWWILKSFLHSHFVSKVCFRVKTRIANSKNWFKEEFEFTVKIFLWEKSTQPLGTKQNRGKGLGNKSQATRRLLKLQSYLGKIDILNRVVSRAGVFGSGVRWWLTNSGLNLDLMRPSDNLKTYRPVIKRTATVNELIVSNIIGIKKW